MKFGPNLQRPLFSNKIKKSKKNFLAGNRTLVSRVTGGDTHHYTTEDISSGTLPIGNCIFFNVFDLPTSTFWARSSFNDHCEKFSEIDV